MKLAAEEAGDINGAAQAQALEDIVWRAISDGAAAGMAHLQRHAGFTRTGAGGVRQEDAHGWIVASWRQHTSRAGDPQLHIHQTILNKARTERDGGMRTLDGRVLYQERGAASAIGTPGDGERPDQGPGRGVGAAGGRARPGDQGRAAGADG